MKRIYWRPRQVSRIVLLLIAALSLAGAIAVERIKVRVKQDHYEDKLEAARLTREAFDVVRAERLRRGLELDVEADPAQSGMIGVAMSPVTSNTGHLAAKRASVNPNFAAVVVELLLRAGVKRGDPIGVGLSGSFPALNVSVLAAARALELEPIIITSLTGSQWGANIPSFLWVDMESTLRKAGVFRFRSVAGSMGGVEDRGLGMTREGRDNVAEAAERNDVPLLRPKTYSDSLEERMRLYAEHAGDRPIAAYVNVGGGATSVGTSVGKRMFSPGLNERPPVGADTPDSVMLRFVREGVPVIHLVQVEELARQHGLPVQPMKVPEVGEGSVFYRYEYNPWLTAGVLLAIVLALFLLVRSDVGFRMLKSTRGAKSGRLPEQMV